MRIGVPLAVVVCEKSPRSCASVGTVRVTGNGMFS